jgi:hypothetical protein
MQDDVILGSDSDVLATYQCLGAGRRIELAACARDSTYLRHNSAADRYLPAFAYGDLRPLYCDGYVKAEQKRYILGACFQNPGSGNLILELLVRRLKKRSDGRDLFSFETCDLRGDHRIC